MALKILFRPNCSITVFDNFIVRSDTLSSLSANRFPKKITPNVPNKNKLGNGSFCSFDSFLNDLIIPFINKPESTRDSSIFMMSHIASFEIINAVVCCAKSEKHKLHIPGIIPKDSPNWFFNESLRLLLMLLMVLIEMLSKRS